MKLVNRIIFALIVALGLMLVSSITDEYYRSREILEIANQKLEDKDYEALISAAYYNETPVFEETIDIENKEFVVIIYEAAHLTEVSSGLKVLDGFQLLVIQKSGEMLSEYFDVLVNANNDVEASYTGFNLYNLGLYSIVDSDTQGSLLLRNYFEKDGVYQTITKITFSKEEEVILEINLSLTEDLFTIKAPLENYVLTNEVGPKVDIEGVNYNEPIVINVSNKIIRNVVIYLVVVILVYCFVFVRKRKFLGRTKATQGLVKDIDRINSEKQNNIKP